MRGMTGEFSFGGEPAGAHPPGDGRSRWQTPDRRMVVETWGHSSPFSYLGWHVDEDAGVGAIADCTLYDRHRLEDGLGLSGWAGTTAELLAHAYLQWGAAMLARLDGDFAFVVCDWRNRSVFAATDPMGMRSLFYRYVAGKGFAFSTRAESLAAWLGLDPRIPESRLLEPLINAEVLAHFQSDIPGVSRLLAAHHCHASATNLKVARYWAPGDKHPGLAESDESAWIDGVHWHLQEATRKRIADGPRLGLAFSGGLDSAAILAMASQMMPTERITAYSVLDRGNGACPETRAINQVLSVRSVASVQVDVADMELHAVVAREVIAGGARFVAGRNGFLALFDHMAAASGIDVMMNGIDADAMFDYGGLVDQEVRNGHYRRAMHDARKLDRLAGGAWMVPEVRMARLKMLLPEGVRDEIRHLRRQVSGGAIPRDYLLRSDAIARLHLRQALRRYQTLPRQSPTASPLSESCLHGPFTLDAVGRFHARTRQQGIEMRCPFLDQELIDFAAWVPLNLRMRNGRLKWILRMAMKPHLPHAVVWRGDKLHLGSHFDRVVLRPILDQVVREFHGSGPAIGPYIDRDRFLREAERWRSGAIEAVWKLKMILLLEHWLRHNHAKVAFGE